MRKSLMQQVCALSLAVILSAGCGGGGGADSSTADSSVAPGTAAEFRPACGVAQDVPVESVKPDDGVFYAQAAAVEPNIVAVDPGTGPFVIKLLGLDFSTQRQSQRAVTRLNELVSGGVHYFPRTVPCSISTPSGGTGTSAQLFTPDGTDIGEQLIREGLSGSVSTSGSCGEEMVGPCYANLKSTVAPQNAGLITEFLWKPSSDGGFTPGHLAVLINTDSDCDVIIVANGETLQNYGPSNGRCMTARSLTRSGCEFGANSKVEIFNASSGLPYVFPDGNSFIINPNGCERLQYKL